MDQVQIDEIIKKIESEETRRATTDELICGTSLDRRIKRRIFQAGVEQKKAVNDYPMMQQILRRYLQEHGFDGLQNPDGDCACRLDDLFPCDEPGFQCMAGYELPCDCGKGCTFHIGKKGE